jgi:hypothetical protein
MVVIAGRLVPGCLGFAAAFAAARWLLAESHQQQTDALPRHTLAREGKSSKVLASLPGPQEFKALTPEAKLRLSLRLCELSSEQREAFLQECLRRDDPEREPLLSLLLLGWAASSPSAACEWALTNLDGPIRKHCLGDLFNTWAVRDGSALARWYDEKVRKEGPEASELSKIDITNPLSQYDPTALAQFAELECNRNSVMWGFDFGRSLRTPEAVQNIASQLGGHPRYIDDPNRLRDVLPMNSSERNAAGSKWGWNALFEETAVAWHRMDANACDAWLSSWPENAQVVARHFIAKAEAKSGEAAPPPAPSPAETPARPAAAVPPPEAWDRARQDWAAWWRQDAAAAEAFLNSSAWPEDLRFRARAKAYSSPP